ncbi:Gag-Pol polyprotein [Penaeus vannamei]|uniref:Gag-Pol polyprotein n=1 Tax=Penaeus vannamei TaxID=6689 RepID=A0A3R7M635_PENVA|nr:Gag-Pol polyprotein [Penaeus vannamei]
MPLPPSVSSSTRGRANDSNGSSSRVRLSSTNQSPHTCRPTLVGAPLIYSALTEFPALSKSINRLPNHGTRSATTSRLTVPCPLSLVARPRQMSQRQGGVRPHEAVRDHTPFQQPMGRPLHLVKKDGDWRPCGDCRHLNTGNRPRQIPAATPALLHELSGCTVFSRIDLVRAYHQIPITEEDIPKTAVITPFALFEFLRMPSVPQRHSDLPRFMNDVTRGLEGVFIYRRHPRRQHLRGRPRPSSPRPLRQTTRSRGRDQPREMSLRRSFALFSRPHPSPLKASPSAGEAPQALHALITPNRASRNTKIKWTPLQTKPSKPARKPWPPPPAEPLPEAPLSIAVDASDTAIALSSSNDRPYVEAKEFHILTDHKPLTFALHSRTRRQSLARSATWTTSHSSRRTSVTFGRGQRGRRCPHRGLP